MENLNNKIFQENYSSHPDFKFNLSEWLPPVEDLNNFNNFITHVRQNYGYSGENTIIDVENKCKNYIEKIFSFLRLQCKDKFEEIFLFELEFEVMRLIQEELLGLSKTVKSPPKISSEKRLPNASKLKYDKYFVGKLDYRVIDKIKKICNMELENFRANAARGSLKREDLSINRGFVIRKLCKLLNKELEVLGVLCAVSAYCQKKMRVTGLSLELSVPQSGWWQNHLPSLARSPHTLYAHLDEGVSFPKAIIYLTDVEIESGPTCCYPGVYESLQFSPLQELIGRVIGVVGNSKDSPLNQYYSKQYHQSVSSENFRKHFMRLPSQMRLNSHFGWDVMPDSALERHLVKQEIKVTGSAGTFIAFDGSRLLHRGGLIEKGDRLALQVVFSDLSTTEEIFIKVRKKVNELFAKFTKKVTAKI